MKYLALDYGEKRTGIAVSDAGGSMAFARTTLPSAPGHIFWRDLLALIVEENPDALILGLPLNLDGEPMQARHFRIDCVPGRVRMHLPGDTALLRGRT